MNCPCCTRGMSPVVDNDATTHWLCVDCGVWPVVCSCGILEGMPHDVMCGYDGPADDTPTMPL